jgi:hypothetical protein
MHSVKSSAVGLKRVILVCCPAVLAKDAAMNVAATACQEQACQRQRPMNLGIAGRSAAMRSKLVEEEDFN